MRVASQKKWRTPNQNKVKQIYKVTREKITKRSENKFKVISDHVNIHNFLVHV